MSLKSVFAGLFFSWSLIFGLNVELSVKECAGVGSNGYPITTVVPLVKGAYQNIAGFRLADGSGNTAPAQIEVLNRRWAGDNSIANLAVTFMPTVSAFSGKGTGMAAYYLKDDGPSSFSGPTITVGETSNDITVFTGPLKFVVKKNGFNILDQVWYDKDNNGVFSSAELVVKSNSHNGGQLIGRLIGDATFHQIGPNQFDADRMDVSFKIEKSGPVEVVIRAEAVTKYNGPSDHTHGWAARIYAYAGKPYIKVDYQLQNSAKTKKYGWPLYFHALNLNFDLNLGATVNIKTGLGDGTVYSGSRGNGVVLAQRKDSLFNVYGVDGLGDTTTVLATGGRPDGFLDMDDGNLGVTVVTRNFWRMWPNGIKIDNANKLSVELFPEWSANVNAATKNGVLNASHLYWLQDMQHVYKEVLFNFHNTGESDAHLIALARTVDYHPVATMALAHIRSASASLDLEGFIPSMSKTSTQDLRLPGALASASLGWNYYELNGRRYGTSEVGGAPFGGAQFWATENPSDWFVSERQVIGELNTRPEWMAQYNHARDFSFLLLGTNMNGVARPRFDPHSLRAEEMGADMFDSAALAPTVERGGNYTFGYTSTIDDSHLWRYHVADGYWITGNPWLKDFYAFQAEYRKNWIDPGRGMVTQMNFDRYIAHPYAEAFQAYKVTGDTSLVRMMVAEVRDFLRKGKEQYGGNGSGWQLGFFMRPLIDLLYEVRESNPQAWAEVFQAVAGAFDANVTYSNFTYDEAPPIIGKSYIGSFSLMDPQAWYYRYTGKGEYRDHLNTYIDWGIGDGGEGPMFTYGITSAWNGTYSGRWVQWARTTGKPDNLPPAAIMDLTLTRSGSQCSLDWTAPSDAKKYHVVWSNRVIAPVSNPDVTKYCNWWAANAIGLSFPATPGTKEHVSFTVPDSGYPLLYAAVFSWDTAWNMSSISNVACQDITPATAPSNLTGNVVDANGIDLHWNASTDPESGIWRYRIYRDGALLAETDSLKYEDRNLQALTEYAYAVSAVSGSNVEGLKATLTLRTIADTVTPVVKMIYSVSLLPQIMLYFSEPMDKASTETASNYSINGGRVVKNASLLPDKRGVLLDCDSLTFDAVYQLTLNGIKDLAASPNSITPNTVLSFTHRRPLSLDSTHTIYRPGVPEFRWDTCAVGKTPYTDWAMPIVSLPDRYRNLPMLMTACNDNAIIANYDPYITFVSNKELRIFLMLDDRQPKPSWLSADFVNTDNDLSLKNARTGDVFPISIYASKTTYPAGKVGLKGLGGNIAYANYFFVVEPVDSSWIVSPSAAPKDTAARRIVWDFLTTTEGWVPNDIPVPKVENSIMKVGGWWACMLSPESLAIDAEKYSFLKIVMRNRSTDSAAIMGFSQTNSFPGINQMNKITFRTCPSDSIFRVYVLDLRPARIGYAWKGSINRLLLQLITHTATTENDSIDIDRIELMPDTTPPVGVEGLRAISEYAEGVAVYPNPFNPVVNIAVQCKTTGLKGNQPVACIYNLQGRLVARITPKQVHLAGKTGRFEYAWNGAGYASGAYVAAVQTGAKTRRKMILLLK